MYTYNICFRPEGDNKAVIALSAAAVQVNFPEI